MLGCLLQNLQWTNRPYFCFRHERNSALKDNYVVSAEPRCDLAKCFLCELSNLVHQPIFYQNHASVMILLWLFSCPQNRTCSAEVMLRSGSAHLGSFRCAPLVCSTAISVETLTAQHRQSHLENQPHEVKFQSLFALYLNYISLKVWCSYVFYPAFHIIIHLVCH